MKGDEFPTQEGFRARYYSEMNYQDYTKTFGTCPPAPKLRPQEHPNLQFLEPFKLEQDTEEGGNSEKCGSVLGEGKERRRMDEIEGCQEYQIQKNCSRMLKILMKSKEQKKKEDNGEEEENSDQEEAPKIEKEGQRHCPQNSAFQSRRRCQSDTNDYLILDILKQGLKGRKMVKRS